MGHFKIGKMKKSRIDAPEKLKMKREKIDLIDKKLITLLNQRLRIALEIGKTKKEMRENIYDPRREKEVLEKLKLINKGPLKEGDLKKIFGIIMRVSRKCQI